MSTVEHNDDAKNTEPHQYVTHNFEAMNRAIDTEVDRRVEIDLK